MMRLRWATLTTTLLIASTLENCCNALSAKSTSTIGSAMISGNNNMMFSPAVYETIQAGQIAVIPEFLSATEVDRLRRDAKECVSSFSTDALSSYGTSGSFDPSRDRTVLKLEAWKNQELGEWDVRQRFGARMADVRKDLAYHLNRPNLNRGLATSSERFGNGSTEISYTRFGAGAFLQRHVDEHHEELKGRAGWMSPTRRSISWLVYLNEPDWNGERDGGQLRCFQRQSGRPSSVVGARPNGDLQIGWIRPSSADPVEKPVFLEGHGGSSCRFYVVQTDGTPEYISDRFDANPILYVAGGEALSKKLLINRSDYAERFHLIEAPKSKLTDVLAHEDGYTGAGKAPFSDEVLAEVDPLGATLVLFDSVSLPHEVLATRGRERWATSGWFHEDQQPHAV